MVIRHKGESQNGSNKKTKYAKSSEKRIFFTPVCVSGVKKCSFFRKFGVFCCLVTSVLRLTFFHYYQKLILISQKVETGLMCRINILNIINMETAEHSCMIAYSRDLHVPPLDISQTFPFPTQAHRHTCTGTTIQALFILEPI